MARSNKPKQNRVITTRNLAKTKKRNVWQLMVVIGLLAVVGLAFVAFSRAGTKPYSRNYCTTERNFMGQGGPGANSGIKGYRADGKPSFQACLDGSAEAWVGRDYIAVFGRNPESVQALEFWSNKFVSYRANPTTEFLQALLATPEAKNGYLKLSDGQRINLLYQRLLKRTPNSSELAWWSVYAKTHSPAQVIASIAGSKEALTKLQPTTNAILSTLPGSYTAEASLCGNNLNQQECRAFVQAVADARKAQQQAEGVPCSQFKANGSIWPVCRFNSAGGSGDVLTASIPGTNVTVNKALASRFNDFRAAGQQEAGINIAAMDIAGPGFGSFRTPAMQTSLYKNGYPAAAPGTSMHEWGLAIDLSCNGVAFANSSGACKNWVKANAGRFGLYNLPSEEWHYSSNGR